MCVLSLRVYIYVCVYLYSHVLTGKALNLEGISFPHGVAPKCQNHWNQSLRVMSGLWVKHCRETKHHFHKKKNALENYHGTQKMKVWFRWYSFSNGSDFQVNQPLIFQSVYFQVYTLPIHVSWAFSVAKAIPTGKDVLWPGQLGWDMVGFMDKWEDLQENVWWFWGLWVLLSEPTVESERMSKGCPSWRDVDKNPGGHWLFYAVFE